MRPRCNARATARVARAFGVATLTILVARTGVAQDTSAARVTVDDRGVVFSAPGRALELGLRMYIQPLITLASDDDDAEVRRVGAQIRRARVSLSGTIADPRLRFALQLGFSRQDVDVETVGIVNTVADANVSWRWTPSFVTSIGQAKVPGNRQGLTSASELEFVERSIVYSAFSLDRDAGVFATYNGTLGSRPLQLRAAVTSGEGRNSAIGDARLAYAARIDWQPLGGFAGSALSEGDVRREPNARLAIGAAWSENHGALRVGGQSGAELFAPRTIRTAFIDAIWKRRGVSVSAEYARRAADDPITTSGTETRSVFVGHGVTAQASYLLSNGFAPVLRFSVLTPDEAMYGASTATERTQSAVGLVRYLRGHRAKWQIELGHDGFRDPVTGTRTSQLYTRWSVLAGI